MDAASLLQLLEEESSQKYFIEYEGYLSNHLLHGIIALARLGANRDRVLQFVKWYTPQLEPTSDHRDGAITPVSADTKLEQLGLRLNYLGLVEYYTGAARQAGSIRAVLRAELPHVYRGLAGSALHALVELGFGLGAGSQVMVCQGLAYLNHSYTPMQLDASAPIDGPTDLSSTEAPLGILDALELLRSDVDLPQRMERGMEKMNTSGFQKKMRYLLGSEAQLLTALSRRIQLPEHVLHAPEQSRWKLAADWLLVQLITVYVHSVKVSDFFLIHGVTGCWSVIQILKELDDPPLEQGVFTVFLNVALATYVIQGSPQIVVGIEACSDESWTQLVAELLSEDRDEHIYKLTMVCSELTRGQKQLDSLCRKAVMIAMRNPLLY